MIESLNTIRSLGLAPVFEDLYFDRNVDSAVAIHMRYPDVFRRTTLAECGPLTDGGLVPIVADGNGDNICLFDPRRRTFVVKPIEEPGEIVRGFGSWQQYLAYTLLEIADSGPDEEEMEYLAQVVGFTHTEELVELLEDLDLLSDAEAAQRCERFIEACVE